MYRLVLFGLVIFGGATNALSCSCAEGITPCSQLQSAQVVFVGRVIVDSGEGMGERLARLIVEEVLHGLPPEIREVEVDTSPRSSCYMRLKLHERYVILADQRQRSTPDRLVSGFCSHSFNLQGSERLLEALRQAKAGDPPSIVGMAYALDNTHHSVPLLPGTRIIAESDTYRQMTTVTNIREFVFSNVPPGTYRLRVDNDKYTEIDSPAYRTDAVTVSPGVCAYGVLSVYPDGQISGGVSDQQGRPASRVTVRAFSVDTHRAELVPWSVRTATADENGRYTFNGLPPGEFVVGTDGEQRSDHSVYPPVVYFGDNEAAHVRLLEFDRIEVNLPPGPRQPATLTVQLRSEDGTPVEGATVRILSPSGAEQFVAKEKSDAQGTVSMEIYEAGRIEVDAFKYFHTGSYADGSIRFRKLIANPGPILFDGPAMTLQIVMREQEPPAR